MTKFVVHTDVEEEEQEVRFALREAKDGGIVLSAVDTQGKPVSCGNVCQIRSDGTLYLFGGVSRHLGLKLLDARIQVNR